MSVRPVFVISGMSVISIFFYSYYMQGHVKKIEKCHMLIFSTILPRIYANVKNNVDNYHILENLGDI